jgi:hypothetical protein
MNLIIVLFLATNVFAKPVTVGIKAVDNQVCTEMSDQSVREMDYKDQEGAEFESRIFNETVKCFIRKLPLSWEQLDHVKMNSFNCLCTGDVIVSPTVDTSHKIK